MNGEVDYIELGIADDAEPISGAVLVNNGTQVYAGYTHNGDGTFSAPPPAPITKNQVNIERDRRINLPVTVTVSAGEAEQKIFKIDMANGGRQNISDMALMAVVKNGAGLTDPFIFRDADNIDQTLSNNEVIEMGMQAAAAYDAIFKKSWALKALDPIPTNYADDSHWI